MKRIKLSGRSVDFIICCVFLILALIIFRDAWQGNFSKTDLDLPFNPVDTIKQEHLLGWTRFTLVVPPLNMTFHIYGQPMFLTTF